MSFKVILCLAVLMSLQATPVRQILTLVTGPSGAGRSSAINVLEDLGHEVIDNLPLSLVTRLVTQPGSRPLALGIDARNRDFSTEGFLDLVHQLRREQSVSLQLLYLDARHDVLLNRFSETRRRHPLAPEESPEVGIAREFDLLHAIRETADILIDTSDRSIHELRAEIGHHFKPASGTWLGLTVQSFSYKRGVPNGLDMMLDVRFLKNPYWEAELRALTGLDNAVQAFILTDKRFALFFQQTEQLVMHLLPAFLDEGKSHLSIGFGCTGGQHRSVAVTEAMAEALAARGWAVSVRHRELERRGLADARREG